MKTKPLLQSLVVLLVAFLTGCASLPGAVTESIDERRVEYVLVRHDTGTVVFENGLGGSIDWWAKVFPEISKDTTAFAYNRPGYGKSDMVSSPRDGNHIVDELRSLLKSKGLKPPYVLVGHSLGGLYQYVYAKLYPNEVAAMVLLDPTHPRHWESLQRDAPEAKTMIKMVRFISFSRTDRAEFDAQAACLDRLNMDVPLRTPVRMLVSERFRPGERGAPEAVIRTLRKDWLRLLGTDRMQTVWDSGHYLQKESPDEVIAAIEEVITHAR